MCALGLVAGLTLMILSAGLYALGLIYLPLLGYDGTADFPVIGGLVGLFGPPFLLGLMLAFLPAGPQPGPYRALLWALLGAVVIGLAALVTGPGATFDSFTAAIGGMTLSSAALFGAPIVLAWRRTRA